MATRMYTLNDYDVKTIWSHFMWDMCWGELTSPQTLALLLQVDWLASVSTSAEVLLLVPQASGRLPPLSSGWLQITWSSVSFLMSQTCSSSADNQRFTSYLCNQLSHDQTFPIFSHATFFPFKNIPDPNTSVFLCLLLQMQSQRLKNLPFSSIASHETSPCSLKFIA